MAAAPTGPKASTWHRTRSVESRHLKSLPRPKGPNKRLRREEGRKWDNDLPMRVCRSRSPRKVSLIFAFTFSSRGCFGFFAVIPYMITKMSKKCHFFGASPAKLLWHQPRGSRVWLPSSPRPRPPHGDTSLGWCGSAPAHPGPELRIFE